MTKDMAISVFMENPKYDSNWIDRAAGMMVELGYSEEELEQYSADQLNFVEQCTKFYGPESEKPDAEFLDMIKNPELNVTQMQILFTVKQKGVSTEDIKYICSPFISYGKMNYAAQAMIDGFNIAKEYNLNEFSIDQIYEIVAGFHSGVDYRLYADNRIPAKHMCVIRTALEVGYAFRYDANTGNLELIDTTQTDIKLEPVEKNNE